MPAPLVSSTSKWERLSQRIDNTFPTVNSSPRLPLCFCRVGVAFQVVGVHDTTAEDSLDRARQADKSQETSSGGWQQGQGGQGESRWQGYSQSQVRKREGFDFDIQTAVPCVFACFFVWYSTMCGMRPCFFLFHSGRFGFGLEWAKCRLVLNVVVLLRVYGVLSRYA